VVATIRGAEYPIVKVFSDDFIFSIPGYQRPYAWTSRQAGELLDDLLSSLGEDNKPISELNPYFLGSIVLIKGDKPDAEVIDGQQRLTTLTILLAALKAFVPQDYAYGLRLRLCQVGDPVAGLSDQYRLSLRQRDDGFFKQYIQNDNGIQTLGNVDQTNLPDSQRNIRDNALMFLLRLKALPEAKRVRLAQFVVTQCFLVVVSTADFDSAYRIFSVMNDRGMDLSLTDILKADVIGQIPTDQQKEYTTKWEDIEEDLGREGFEALFSYIRFIYRKSKPQKSVLEEFRNYVFPGQKNKSISPKQLIDDLIHPYATAFSEIHNLEFSSTKNSDEINLSLSWLNWIDNSDWLPPAILYLSLYRNEPDLLLSFFKDLDRLASGLMILRTNINDRVNRYSKLLTAIESKADLFASGSPLQLTATEQRQVIKILDGNLYQERQIRLYVLLRLDAALSEGDASYSMNRITVEHVLPQNPPPNGDWIRWFDTSEKRSSYVHRLGNLVLLSRAKNAAAQNYEFAVKKQKYFTTRQGISPFVLTTQVLQERTWTPTVVEKRQKELIAVLKQLWKLL
jgi:Protein of unknown function DUF262/Protein of unknown function (DUF1524)